MFLFKLDIVPSMSSCKNDQKRFLLVRSSDRKVADNGTPDKFVVHLYDEIKPIYMELSSITLMNTFYNINDYNNKFYINGTSFTLTNGSYDVTTLAAAIVAQALADLSLTITVTYSSTTTFKYTIASATPFTLEFANSPANSIGPVIGFTTTRTSGTSHVGNMAVNLHVINDVQITIDEIREYVVKTSSNSTRTYLWSVPLTVNGGEIQHVSGSNLAKQGVHLGGHIIKRLSVTVFVNDQQASLNSEWSFMIGYY